jgi:hypothetical protein
MLSQSILGVSYSISGLQRGESKAAQATFEVISSDASVFLELIVLAFTEEGAAVPDQMFIGANVPTETRAAMTPAPTLIFANPTSPPTRRSSSAKGGTAPAQDEVCGIGCKAGCAAGGCLFLAFLWYARNQHEANNKDQAKRKREIGKRKALVEAKKRVRAKAAAKKAAKMKATTVNVQASKRDLDLQQLMPVQEMGMGMITVVEGGGVPGVGEDELGLMHSLMVIQVWY